MSTTPTLNGEAQKCIEKFEREHKTKLPPMLLGYVHPKKPWHKFTNYIAAAVFKFRLALWTKSVMRASRNSLRAAEKCNIPPTL